MMSAQEYRAKAEILVMRANASTEEAQALEWIGLAAEWRRLADVADWQDAIVRHAIGVGEAPQLSPAKP